MPLYRLCYFSIANPKRMDRVAEDFRAISEASALANEEHAISGGLIYADYHYAQVLEGRRRLVSDVLRRIMRDERHVAVQIVTMMPIRERAFPGWHATFVGPSGVQRATIQRYGSGTTFGPSELAPSGLIELIHALTVGTPTSPPALTLVEPTELVWEPVGSNVFDLRLPCANPPAP